MAQVKATAAVMIAVPQDVDQFGSAGMPQGLGVARHVPREEATAKALRAAALALVDDPDVVRRLTEIRAGTAGEGGTRRAADLIEAELLRRVRTGRGPVGSPVTDGPSPEGDREGIRPVRP